jgi:hypothetical protein
MDLPVIYFEELINARNESVSGKKCGSDFNILRKRTKKKERKKNTFWSNDESQYSMRGCRMWNEIYINFSHGPFLGFGREGNVE